MLAQAWETVKMNFDLLLWKWNQAMKNHAKNGERNVYAEELLLYVLYTYAACGILVLVVCLLVALGVIKRPEPKPLVDPEITKQVEESKKRKKMKKMKWFPADVVAKHNTPKDCWIIINNKVYNVTKHVAEHPGDDIVDFAGGDFTAEFERAGANEEEIDEYFIGYLIESDKDK